MKTNYSHKNCQNPTASIELMRKNRKLVAIVTGLFFIAVAFLLIGHSLGFISNYAYQIIISWQMLLIALGVIQILTWRHFFCGLVLIIVGSVFLIPKLFILPVALANLTFPAILFLIGLVIIIRPRSKRFRNFHKNFEENKVFFNNDTISEKYVFVGTNLIVSSQNFKGGNIETVFGGGRLDLSQASLSAEKPVVLNLELVFGGFEIIVPSDWKINVKSKSVFGGISEKKNDENLIDPNKEVFIVCEAVFGGAEIKRA